jgi:hypothetical protein
MPEIVPRTSYNDLLLRYNDIDHIPYLDLLETKEWFEKRNEIIERDDHKCSICGNRKTEGWNKNPDGSFRYYWVEFEIIDGNSTIVFHHTDRKIWIHVHHKFYIKNFLPWQYASQDLISYCNWCHFEFHKENKVKIFELISGELHELNYSTCRRCNGAGWFPEYRKIQNGVCFRCHGLKYEELILT